jgi:glycosyltransferase involved in cell wall biosynthesis
MNIGITLNLLKQRARENDAMVHTALLGLMARGGVDAVLRRRANAVAVLSQVHRTTRLPTMRRLVEPYIFANRDVTYAAPRIPAEGLPAYFLARMTVLKEPQPGERGVLFVLFTELLALMFAGMDMARLVADYTIVVEPSWTGYCDPDFLRLTQLEDEVFVLGAEPEDYAFLRRLRSNLVPVALGFCDWVDPRVAEPFLGNPKEFDIVMNGHWGASKRHHVLFRFLRRARRKYKVLLIGGAWEGRTIDDVRALAAHFGVASQLTLRERLPYEQVMDLTARARISVLLSLKEGSNRAIAESLFCDVPVIVLANNVGGAKKNVVPETGELVAEHEIEGAVERLLDGNVRPRAWALEHRSCFRSTAHLNAVLREHALAADRPWTRDIAVRANSPESKYVDSRDAARLAPWNARLLEYLKPQASLA